MFIMPPCFNAGDIIYFFFDTYDSNGASVTISNFLISDIEVYKNGSTTQRSSDNGYALLDTDGIDFDGAAGLHGFSIDTSDDTVAGFWTDGAQYLIHVNAITVDVQTVRFSYFLPLGYSLRPITPGRKAAVAATGHVGPDWGNVGSPTTANALTGTSVTLTSGERDAVAAALLDLTNGIETGLTLRQAQRLLAAAAAGKLSGAATTTIVIRNAVADSTNRITATVDADGNRSAITYNLG